METIVEESRSIEYLDKEWIIETDFGRVLLRHEGSDVDVFWQIFIEREYDTVVDTALLNNIEIKTIVDAGGNIGLTSLKFLKQFPDSQLVALEPDAENYVQLEKNTSQHSHRITLLKKALWSEDTTVYLHNDFRDSREWSRHVSTEKTANLVNAISLNSIILDFEMDTIDLLKMDIEGGEADIFKSTNDLSFLNITKIIAIEIHDEFDCRQTINDVLLSNGFVLYHSGELTIGLNTSYI